jgi:hypothetical protein
MATPGALNPILGRPTVSAKTTASFRMVTIDGNTTFAPGKGVIDGTRSRDPGNTGFTTTLRSGLLLAKNSTTGKYATWSIGQSTAGLAGAGTTLNIGAAGATELARRVGSSGTFVLTGNSASGGTVVQRTVTYSAVNTTTGDVTITAMTNVNQVERIRFNIASTGGNIQLTVQKTDGTTATTANAAWNATDATYLAAIQTQLDTTTGVSNGIVVSASAGIDTDIELVLTYSGTGYAGKSWTPAVVAVFPTSSTLAFYTPMQTASGTFATGAVVSEVGYSAPITYIPESVGVMIPADGTSDTESRIPISAAVYSAQLIPAVSDTAVKLWVQQSMSTLAGGKFAFDNVI